MSMLIPIVAIFLIGLGILVKGEFQITRNRKIEGHPALAVGLIIMATAVTGFLVDMMVSAMQQGERNDDVVPDLAPSLFAQAIVWAIGWGIAIAVGLIFSREIPPSELARQETAEVSPRSAKEFSSPVPWIIAGLCAFAVALAALLGGADGALTFVLALLGALLGFLGGAYAQSVVPAGARHWKAAQVAGSIATGPGALLGGGIAIFSLKADILGSVLGCLIGGVVLGFFGAVFGVLVTLVRGWIVQREAGGPLSPR